MVTTRSKRSRYPAYEAIRDDPGLGAKLDQYFQLNAQTGRVGHRTKDGNLALLAGALGIDGQRICYASKADRTAKQPKRLRLPVRCPFCGTRLGESDIARVYDHRRERIKVHRFCLRLSQLLCSIAP